MASHADDISLLPPEVRADARVFPNGEVAWPNEHAERAITALADVGKIILGLDARTLFDDGSLREVPISAWRRAEGEPQHTAVARARREALDALPLARREGSHVLITWG